MAEEYTMATIAHYAAMQAAGATPTEVARQAFSDGLSKFHVACAMRDVFGLNLRESLEILKLLA